MIDQSWRDCIEAFLRGNQSATSRATYRSILSTFLTHLGLVSPGAATDATIESFLAAGSHAPQNRGQAVSASTYRRRVGILASFYRFAQTYLVDGTPLYQKPLPALLANWQERSAGASLAHDLSFLPTGWRQCCTHWLQSIYDHSGSRDSMETYESVIVRFLRFVNKDPGAVSRGDVQSWLATPVASRRNTGHELSASAKNQRMSAISSFYTYA